MLQTKPCNYNNCRVSLFSTFDYIEDCINKRIVGYDIANMHIIALTLDDMHEYVNQLVKFSASPFDNSKAVSYKRLQDLLININLLFDRFPEHKDS